ncbi:MAG: hypothetical protein NC218_11800 [Acetobacter sp.]|nr:hypothetical protein [Acetobacter sp.]
MTKKQMRKLAQEIATQNKAYETAKTQEEQAAAEQRIFSITKQVLSLPHGLEILGEIDSLVQTLL